MEIILNDVKFYNEKEYKNSLFEKNGTKNLYYKLKRNRIELYNNGIFIGCITANRILCKANLLNSGKYFFNFGSIKELGEESNFNLKLQEEVKVLSDKYLKQN